MIYNSKRGSFPKMKANKVLLVGGHSVDIKGKVEQKLGHWDSRGVSRYLEAEMCGSKMYPETKAPEWKHDLS